VVASLFCAVAFEIAKRLYALYVARFVTFDRVASDANLIGFLLFVLWIYYTAYMFLLGGEGSGDVRPDAYAAPASVQLG